MDLSKLDVKKEANAGSIMYICHPVTGEVLTDEGEKAGDPKNPKKFFIRLLGSDSDAYQGLIKRRIERRTTKKGVKKIDVDQAQRDTAELYTKCSTEVYLIDSGKVVDSVDDLFQVYMNIPWLKEQVSEFVEDRANFIKS